MGKILTAVLLLLFASCAPKGDSYATAVKVGEPQLPTCEKPLGTLVVRGFECKASACRGGKVYFPSYKVKVSQKVLGKGLADMLLTALVKTGCFTVLERERLKEIKEELRMAGLKPEESLPGAQYLLTGAITAVEMDASGGSGTIFAVPVPFAGAVGLKAKRGTAHVALDLRLVRVKDGSIILAETVEGKSERWKVGVGGGGLIGSVVSGGWFEVFENTPMEEATRDLIYRAVSVIVERVKREGLR